MTSDPTIDQRISAWLTSDAPAQLPDRVLARTFASTRASHQVGRLPGWRSYRMRSMPVAIAAGAVAILVLVLGGVALFGSRPAPVAPAPGPTTSAAPTATSTAAAPSASAASSVASGLFQVGRGIASQGLLTFSFSDAKERRYLYTIKADGSGLSQIVASEACCGVFSPDGTRLAVGEVDPATHSYRTVIFPVGGGASTVMPSACSGCKSIGDIDFVPRAWSPDGRFLAIQGTSDAEPQQTGLYMAAVDGTKPFAGRNWESTATGAGRRDVPLVFAPSGGALLFKRSTGDGDNGDLYVTQIDPQSGIRSSGTKINPNGTSVASSDAFGSGASWSPDGTKIAFAANGASSHGADIEVVDVATLSVTDIAAGSQTTTSARWSPDGQWIAYDIPSDTGPHDEWIVHPDGSGGRNLTSTFDGGVCCAEWSPDSRYLVMQGGSYQGTGTPDQLIEVGIDGSMNTIVQFNTPTQPEDYGWAP